MIRQRSNELYSISFSNEISKQKRYINIQYLNNLIPVEINEIMTKIENTFKRHTFQKEVSINGIEYIPFSKIQENIMLSNFTHENKAYRIADYKSFIKAEDRKFEMKKLFISYSSRNTIFKDRFITHLAPHKRNGMIDVWHDRDIETGEKWEAAILAEIDNSDLIIFLLSPDFINTNYIFDVEIPKAMERNKQNLAKFHFIILKSCQWEATVLNEYMMQLQSGFDGKKLVTIGHPDNDDQWTEAVKDLMAKLYAQKQV